MNRINSGRVVLGGLLAGLVLNVGETVLNVVVLASDLDAVAAARNVPPVGGSAIAGFVVMCFALGIGMVWLYAAIRPRFGAGVKTALIVGFVVWLMAFVWSGLGNALMQFIPFGLTATGLVWALGETMIAAVAGAWAYKE